MIFIDSLTQLGVLSQSFAASCRVNRTSTQGILTGKQRPDSTLLIPAKVSEVTSGVKKKEDFTKYLIGTYQFFFYPPLFLGTGIPQRQGSTVHVKKKEKKVKRLPMRKQATSDGHMTV